jgi:hypothetical protein
MGNVVAVPIRTVSVDGDTCEIRIEHVLYHGLVLPFRRPAAKPPTRWVAHGRPTACAHCRQPFPISEDRAQAQAGRDGRLYCHGTDCEQETTAVRPRRRRSVS